MSLLDDATPVANVPKHLFMCIWGPPGVGKTILACKTANKTLIITDEKAAVSISQFPELADTVSTLKFKNYDHLMGVVRELYQGGHDYDHFMIDTLDGVVRKKLKEQREKIDFSRHNQTNDINSLEDYNLLNNHMFDLFGRLAMLPISVTVTSHDRLPDPQSYGKGDRLLRPSIPFRAFECLNGYANVVGYMHMRKNKNKDGELIRAVALQSNDEYEAKNHLKLGPLVSDTKFIETVRNWKGI